MTILSESLLEDLGRNIALVLGLMFSRGLLRGVERIQNERPRAVFSGLLFGLAAVASMSAPVHLAPGVIVDMRNVLVALSYCFEGPLAGTLSALIAISYRIGVGGTGVVPGVLLIVAAAGIGALFLHKLKDRRAPHGSELVVMGGCISMAGLLLTSLLVIHLPLAEVLTLTRRVLPAVIFGYPIGTLLVGTLLSYESRRIEAERALLRERDLLSRVASTSPSGIVALDKSGTIVMANAQAAQVLGAQVSQLMGRRYDERSWAVTDYDGRPLTSDQLPFAEVSRTRLPVRGARLATAASGQRVFLSINAAPMFDEHGAFAGMVATIEDVTERVLAERRLQESEEKFRTLFDRASDAIFVQPLDEGASATFIEVNDVACRWLGRSRAELLQRTFAEIDDAHDASELKVLFAAAQKRAVTFETKIVTLSGEPRDVEVVAQSTALMGRPVIMALARDLSERRKLERQVLESQKMEVVGRLAGGIAHDFNNVLAIIMFSGEIIERARDLSTSQRLARDIIETAERGASLTRQLLTFSRKQVAVPSTVRFASAVHNLLRLVRRIIPANIEIETQLTEEGSVRVDLAQLEQVLLNLMVNARDAMPHGGRLKLSCLQKTLDAVDAKARGDLLPGPYLMLEVTDDGMGMSEEVLQHIYEPFFTTKREQGTGLGLSICFNIVRQAGGYIEALSTPGVGSTFRVYLPRVPDESSDAATAQTISAVGKERILLVEDEAPLRGLMCTFLLEAGYEVSPAANASEALTALGRGKPFDLLVTDVMLPGLSGPELFEELRRVVPRLSVVYISGYAADALSPDALSQVQVHLVHKPFTTHALARAVRVALDERSTHS